MASKKTTATVSIRHISVVEFAIQCPMKTTRCCVAPCKQNIQTLVPENPWVSCLLHESLHKHISIGVTMLSFSSVVCLYKSLQRFCDAFIHEIVARFARIPKSLVIEQPVEWAQASAVRQIFLRQIECLREFGLLTSHLAPVGAVDGITKKQKHGCIERQLEKQRLEVDYSVTGNRFDKMLDAFFNLFKIVHSV